MKHASTASDSHPGFAVDDVTVSKMRGVRDFLTSLVHEVSIPFSMAICGSAAVGILRPGSDIELLIIAEPHHVGAILNTAAVRSAFPPTPHPDVLDLLASGAIDAVRLTESDIGQTRYCVNVFTTRMCNRIAALDDGPVRKLRGTPKHETAVFRGLAYHETGETIPLEVQSSPLAQGYVTQTRIVQFQQRRPFFHIIADKFYTSVFLWDELNVRRTQAAFRQVIQDISDGLPGSEPTGFLHNRRHACSSQLARMGRHARDAALDDAIASAQSSLCHISGPSGVGKDTAIRGLTERFAGVRALQPHTTRPARRDGTAEYHHIAERDFLSLVLNDEFYFWHYDGPDSMGNPKYYGILRTALSDALATSRRVLFSFGNTWAARFFKSRLPGCTTVYLYPQQPDQLFRQLRSRATDTDAEIHLRAASSKLHNMALGHPHDIGIVNADGRPGVMISRLAGLLGLHHD